MNAPTPLPETWAPGALIPGTVYRIIRPIGQGGMGEVYEVEHNMLGTRRALKVLVKHYAGREDLAERLRVEARGLARLKHPNLVEVYDLGTAADGRIFFAMELLDGVTLRAMLRDRGRLSVRTSVELVVQVLAGLHAAHVAGILHRDVKPENVFVCRDGMVKLLDFGVAKAIDAWLPDQKITGAGMTVGTPRYMSPEQAEGAAVDRRTDIYATGQMLWEMLAGRPAFEETDPFELAQAKWKRGVLPLGSLPGVEASPELCSAVDRACQADPARRYPTAEAFIRALRTALGDVPSQPTPTPIPPGDTQAYLAGVGKALPDSDTEYDPAMRAALGGTVPLPNAASRELTERVDAIRPVNRDAPTAARPLEPRPKGPSGTEVLPAIAAQHEPVPRMPASTPSPASPPSTMRVRPTEPARKRGPMGIPYLSWLAGGAAFAIPVAIAGAIGAWQFWTPHAVESSSEQSAAPVEPWPAIASVPTVSDASVAEIRDADSEVAPPVVASTAPPLVPEKMPPVPAKTAKAPPKSTKAEPPTTKTGPAKTRESPPKMPKSGL